MDDELNLIGEKLIRRAAKEERRLLEREAAAEAELRQAVARLKRAGERLLEASAEAERRARAVARAESALLACQVARAAGPGNASPVVDTEAPPVIEEPPPAPARRTRRKPPVAAPADAEVPT